MMSIPTNHFHFNRITTLCHCTGGTMFHLTSVCQLSSFSSFILCEATFLLFSSGGQAKWLLQVAIR